jgi:ATP-dependent protease ClpP protease subunit
MKKLLSLLAILPLLAFATDNPVEKLELVTDNNPIEKLEKIRPNSNDGINKSEEANGLRNITLSKSNSINFNSKFTSSFVAKKQIEAMAKCLSNIGSEINIVLYTPGGSVAAGQRFFDTLNALPCKFNTITLFAASMGYQTVQNLGKRYIVPSGILMSHRAFVSGLAGEIDGELESIFSLLKTNVNELDKIASKRVGIELKEYKELIRDELWMTGHEAVSMKHADELVLVKCDSTLQGTYIDTVSTMFGPLDVEFAQCPVITGILSVRRGSRKARAEVIDMYQNIANHIKTEL